MDKFNSLEQKNDNVVEKRLPAIATHLRNPYSEMLSSAGGRSESSIPTMQVGEMPVYVLVHDKL